MKKVQKKREKYHMGKCIKTTQEQKKYNQISFFSFLGKLILKPKILIKHTIIKITKINIE